MTKKIQNTQSEQKQEKKDRLSHALRDNLKRRKAQARKTIKNETKED